MYKPANLREFVTPAVHKKPASEIINGHDQKTYTAVGTIKGKFKQKTTSELNANGLSVVEDKISFITWWSSNLEAQDVLTINNIDYGNYSFYHIAYLQAKSIFNFVFINNCRSGWIERLHHSSFSIQRSARRHAIQREVFRSSQPIHQ